MQTKKVIPFITVIAFVLFAFTPKHYYETQKYTSNHFLDVNRAFAQLDQASENFRTDKIDADSLRKVFLKTRKAYKKVEFILAYSYPEYVSETINGAPLLHLEKENSRPLIANPVGLQVLDEMIFSDDVQNEKNEIANLSRRLKNNYSILYEKIGTKAHTTNGIVAMRLQLVRILSMSITGFDTPGSLNAIDDTSASLEGMQVYFNENYAKAPKQSQVKIKNLFKTSITYLEKNPSFETFDRLVFFKEYIDPLYKELGNIQENTDAEFLLNTTSWNPESTSIFSENFLNPYFFTELTQEEDSDGLRTLGEHLFYDPLISSNGNISCASCHQPEKGFTDAVPKSMSNVQGKTVLRNAPTLLNSVYADRYFYDLRAFTLEQQSEHVIFNPDEFNTVYSTILKKLNGQPKYRESFKKVFGNTDITRENFSKALTSYVLSLKSFNSPFDKYVRGENEQISEDVKNGFNLFMGKASCATCHFAPTFSGLIPPFYTESESEILGVLEIPNSKKIDSDNGRYSNKIESEDAWIYEKSFKTTTVRNAEITAPYFHNGAYETLEEVIDFYNNGGGGGIGLNVQNQTLASDPLDLTDKEKADIIAFMKSLTDNPVNR